MKYLLLALFAVTFVGYASSCDRYKVEQCIREKINCASAGVCDEDAKICGETEKCYTETTSCTETIRTMQQCSALNACTDVFPFRAVVENKCSPMRGVVASGASVPTGLVTMIVCSLAYLVTEI